MNKINKINVTFFMTVIMALAGNLIIPRIVDPGENQIATLVFSQIFLVLPTLVYITTNRFNLSKTIRFNRIKASNVLLLIIFAYAVAPLMSMINMISMLFVRNDINSAVLDIVDRNPFYLSIGMIAIVPAILEESVYRGVFFNEYRKINLIKGIFLSAFLFALMHLNFNQFFYAFVMGVVFVLVIEATDSIVSSMLIHFVINASSVLSAYMLPRMQDLLNEVDPTYATDLADSMNMNPTRTELMVSIYAYIPIVILGLAIAVITYLAIAKNSDRLDHVKSIFSGRATTEQSVAVQNEEVMTDEGIGMESAVLETSSGGKIMTPALILGIVVCIVWMILNEMSL